MGQVNLYPEMTVREAAARLYGFRDDDTSWQGTLAMVLAGMATEAYVQSAIAGGLASGNYLIDGGGVSWEGDYDYHVAAASYVIQGDPYTSAAADVTLSAADPSDDRIDIIAVDVNGDVVVIEGTPSATPQAPDVDAETQLQLTFVYVPAGSTEPDVTNLDLYLDNAEWTYTDNAATLNGDSTADPHVGTKSIEATAAAAGDFFTLTAPSGTIDLADYNNVVLWIKPKATWPGAKNLKAFWLDGGVQVGTQVVIKQGTFGFDTATAAYQAIVIPASQFNAGGQAVNKLRVKVAGGGAAIGFFADDIVLQAGVSPSTAGTAMQFIGDHLLTLSYSQQQVVRDSGYSYVAAVANQNSAPEPDDSNAAWKRIALNLRFDIDGTLAANSDSFVATQKATKTYADAVLAAAEAYTDSHVVGLYDDRGNFDASGGAYPSSGGSGTAGAILKGDIWRISVGGTLPTGVVLEVNDTIRALIDTPGNTQANWAPAKNNAQTSVSGNAGTATALQTSRNIDGQAFNGTVDITVIAPGTHAATGKTTPVDADELALVDSQASNVLKKLTWANLKATLKTYFDSLYPSGSYASAAEYRVGTEAAKVLSPDAVWDAAAYVALTDAATVAVDLSTGLNFTLTIGGNRTLGAPSNGKEGQTGVIQITQDGTGNRTLGYNAVWKFAGGTDPVLSTAAGTIDLLFYEVLPGGSNVFGNLVKAIA